MQRSFYWDLCEQKLSILCTRIEMRGKLNILNFHLHSENFYLHFLNKLYGYSLQNMNVEEQNVEGIDLRDDTNQIVLQVSSTATKTKIENALGKNLSKYGGYGFKFVSISKDASELRTKTYANPHNLAFSPSVDIHDVPSLLKHIQVLEVDKLHSIYSFLKAELDPTSGGQFTETSLASVIKLLASEDLGDGYEVSKPIPFNVDSKLAFNSLNGASIIIEDYKIHHHRVSRIYNEFDVAGRNKSNLVMQSLRTIYAKLSTSYAGDALFFKVVEEAVDRIRGSANYVEMPLDELEQYVNVLAVDAFIRCKIFKNPNEVANAPS